MIIYGQQMVCNDDIVTASLFHNSVYTSCIFIGTRPKVGLLSD